MGSPPFQPQKKMLKDRPDATPRQLKQSCTLKPHKAEVRDKGPSSKKTLYVRAWLKGRDWRGAAAVNQSDGEKGPSSTPLFSSLQFFCHWAFCLSPLGLSHKKRIFPFLVSPLLVFIYSISRHAGQNGPFLVSKMALDSFAARHILTASHERAFSMMLALFRCEYSVGKGISGSVTFGCCSRCGKQIACTGTSLAQKSGKVVTAGHYFVQHCVPKHLCLECSALLSSLNYFIS
ncbi:uncharacterized [Tachysurus ichikawai]